MMKNKTSANHRLPARTLVLSLPALTVDEVEALVRVVEDFSVALWSLYDDALFENYTLREQDEAYRECEGPDDTPPF